MAPLQSPPMAQSVRVGTTGPDSGDPMRYLLLIMEPHGQRAERGLAGGQEAYARTVSYTHLTLPTTPYV